MPDVGQEGQEKLIQSRVAIVGAGGLGAASLSYLAAAGVGYIRILDDDTVELSNLNRQIIHETGDIGRLKVQSAADRISELNPHVMVETHAVRLDTANASYLLNSVDLVVDGCDNFAARYAINEACLAHNIPWIYAALRGFDAQLSVFAPSDEPQNACYRCLVPNEPIYPQNCEERGVIGALVGVIGALQTMEALKMLAGLTPSYINKLLQYNALNGQFRISLLSRDPACAACGNKANYVRQ